MDAVNGNERAAILGQLIAVRNVVDGLIASVQEEPETVCEHPMDQRKYTGDTMGSSAGYTCQRCGAVVVAVQDTQPILSRFVRPGLHAEGE